MVLEYSLKHDVDSTLYYIATDTTLGSGLP